jgi:HPt (histidine-containing phosphotransfer) domain-containing protein
MAESVTAINANRQPRGNLETSSETIVIQVNPRIGDIVDSYLENRNKDVDSLLNALERGEFEQIRHLAHDLVGTGGSFGFEDMSLIGRSLENAAANKEIKEIKLLVEDLAEYLANVKVVY